MIPSAEQQLLFLQKIQLILDEGSFTSTYKYALLLSLADLSIEQGDEQGSALILSISQLAEKFIRYYWLQARPYPGQAEPGILKQNTGQQAAIINHIISNQKSHNQLSQVLRNNSLISNIATIVRDMPVWRLQRLPGGIDDFLYEQTEKGNDITLRPGVAYCFRVFHSQITNMVQGAWVRWIRSLRQNQTILGQHADLHEFLFGSERASLAVYTPLLKDIQQNTCFYCARVLGNSSEVDHFIPWSRYPADLGHNFVLAHRACNNDKRDLLASVDHLQHWVDRNKQHAMVLTNYFDEHQIPYDLTTSLAITRWAYSHVEAMGGDVWLATKGKTQRLDYRWRACL